MSDFVPNNRHLRSFALSETTCRDWFRRYKDGGFDVDDRPREGRPKTFEDADVIYYELLKPNDTIAG